MKKILTITLITMMILSGCAALMDTKKDITIVEDIIDDVVKEETGLQIKLSPSDQ